MTPEIEYLIGMVQNVSLGGIFFFLYYREKIAHENTRQLYREDLREISGFKSHKLRLSGTMNEQPDNDSQVQNR